MTEEFGGDVLLFDTEDGGEISVINGLVIADGGFNTAVYLSLFGGNKDDGGEVASGDTWWGTGLKVFLRMRSLFLALCLLCVLFR